jgi:hypothetical protein
MPQGLEGVPVLLIALSAGIATQDRYRLEILHVITCNEKVPYDSEKPRLCGQSNPTESWGAFETLENIEKKFKEKRGNAIIGTLVPKTKVLGDQMPNSDVLGGPTEWPNKYYVPSDVYINKFTSECKESDGTSSCIHKMTCMSRTEMWGQLEGNPDSVLGLITTADRTGLCILCAPTVCTSDELKCPMGTAVSSAYVPPVPDLISAIKDSNGQIARLNKPNCQVVCPAGTWLTCTDPGICAYIAPGLSTIRTFMDPNADKNAKDANTLAWMQSNRRSSFDVKVPIGQELGIPIDTCYPCAKAAGIRHYGTVANTDPAHLRDGFLQFECPGGSSAPNPCPENMLSKVDPVTGMSTPCACRPGTYAQGGKCSLCPEGNRCLFAQAPEPCPIDTYALTGSSQCLPCSKDTSRCGQYYALERCSGGPEYQNRDTRCIDCNNCKELSTNTLGTRPCLDII